MPFTNYRAMFTFVLLFSCIILGISAQQTVFNLTILHTNDIHAKFCEINENGGPCTPAKGMCYGGYARRMTKVNEIRASKANVVLLEGGERLYGVPAWFETYGGLASSYFMNQLGYDAMGFGMYDFERGASALLPFLKNITFPLVISNLDSSPEPEMAGIHVTDHEIDVNGVRVGVVGFIWPNASDYKRVEPLIINPIIPSVQASVDNLIAKGINKIIALGGSGFDDFFDITNSGFDIFMDVANNVAGIDIIVAGTFSPTLLWNGDQPSVEAINGPYPITVNPVNDPSATVLIVTTYPNGKYLGNIDVGFDDEGVVTTFNGNPILLDDSVEQDPAALADVESRKESVKNFEDEIIGETLVTIDGMVQRCGSGECNMGTLLADAMVWEWARNSSSAENVDGWTEVTMAFINMGNFNLSQERARGDISFGDIKNLLPWGDTFDIGYLTGKNILDALEEVAMKNGSAPGQSWWYWGFLQVSGMKVVFDMTKPIGLRVQSVHVLCRECDIPQFEPLDKYKEYRIVVNSYLAGGGDGLFKGPDVFVDRERGKRLDTDVLSDYIRSTGPIAPGLEGRIIVYDAENPAPMICRNPAKQRKQPVD